MLFISEIKEAFSQHQDVLKDNIIVDFLVPCLVSNGFLSQEEGEILQEEKTHTRRDLLFRLLNLNTVTEEDLVKFRKGLVETGQPHLAKLLLEPSES